MYWASRGAGAEQMANTAAAARDEEMRCRLREEMGQFCRMRPGVGAVKLLQCLAYSSVKPYPSSERQLFAQGLLYQRVRKLVAAYRIWQLLYKPRSQGLLQYVQ